MVSLIQAKQVLIHFDSIDIPDHLGLGHWSHPPQILEETTRHLLIQLPQCRLHLTLQPLNHLYYALGTFGHILAELELRPYVLLLVELHIARLEEMALDGNASLDATLRDLPLRHPLASVKVGQLHVLARNTHVNIQRLLRQIHKHCIHSDLP